MLDEDVCVRALRVKYYLKSVCRFIVGMLVCHFWLKSDRWVYVKTADVLQNGAILGDVLIFSLLCDIAQ